MLEYQIFSTQNKKQVRFLLPPSDVIEPFDEMATNKQKYTDTLWLYNREVFVIINMVIGILLLGYYIYSNKVYQFFMGVKEVASAQPPTALAKTK